VTQPDPAELGDELINTTAALRRLVRRTLRPSVAGPQLRGAQVELLRIVETQPGIGVAAAARALHLAANSVSTLVNQLVDLGMVIRGADQEDRRAVRLELTPEALRRMDAWRRARAELVRTGMARLSAADRAAIATALPAIRRLLGELEEGDHE
jgi:DNA-binding MarR family transcriptional regulator